MSSVDRAFIRAYGPEVPTSDDPAAEYSRSVPVFPGGPTVEQLYEWRKKGLRIDLPGSPTNEGDLGDLAAESEEDEAPTPEASVFDASAQNTAAVAAAVDRILKRVRAEKEAAPPVAEVSPAPSPPKVNKPEAKQPAPEKLAPEKQPAKSIAPPAGKTSDRLEWESMLTTSSAAPKNVTFRPQWEAPRFAWPATIEMLLERGFEGFAEVRDRLTEVSGQGKKVVAVYSFAAGEGCSTLTLCLAKMLAGGGMKTAIVDASDTNPELATRLGVRVEHGWEAIAEGGPTVEDAAIHSVIDDLTLAPSLAKGTPEKLDQMLQSMKGSYDMILVDVGQVHDVPNKVSQIDAAMIVRDLRISDDSQVAEVVRRLAGAGISILGVTENFVG
ncbi:P-loop NTPase family protein [Blastopirellula retiformator]|uniref:Uncharacterized protein n=1 Tax=Blastopirellula retiformator TaxID=2527970 RepID=A0A5C5V102_9BACT|nr:hypothetical protein [Blastopirellula retiformator]TWT31699.1 hypothetical protein Enr8_36230 [Blastopirellula retiformator]